MTTITKIQAAMFAAIGSKTKFSRSGCSVVFTRPVLGRNDLSDYEPTALEQAEAAGLDLDTVTAEMIDAYQNWYSTMYETRRIAEARILITRKFGMERGRSLVPSNRVSVVDGWGETLDSIIVPCTEYRDVNVINNMGRRGAYCTKPDYQAINRAVATLRGNHSEFAAAPVQDNNEQGSRINQEQREEFERFGY